MEDSLIENCELKQGTLIRRRKAVPVVNAARTFADEKTADLKNADAGKLQQSNQGNQPISNNQQQSRKGRGRGRGRNRERLQQDHQNSSQNSLIEKNELKQGGLIRRRKAIPVANAAPTFTDKKAAGLKNAHTGKLQQSNQGKQPISNNQQQSKKGRGRRQDRRRGRGCNRERLQQDHQNTSQNNLLDVMSLQPQAANGSTPQSKLLKPRLQPIEGKAKTTDFYVDPLLSFNNKDTFEEDKDDDGKLLVSLKEEPLVQNSEVSSSPCPPFGTKRNKDDLKSILSVPAREDDLECLSDFVEESSVAVPLNGQEERDFFPVKKRGWWGVFQGRHYNDQARVTWSRTIGSNVFLKWLFIVLNVVVEIWQSVLTQEEAEGKMGHKIYLKLSIITSFVCLMMSLVEAYHQGRSSKVGWQRRGRCCWFYYPGQTGRLFGGTLLYFGIICSMVQFIVNLTAKLTNKNFIKFDYVSLLLSVCNFVSAIVASREKTGLLAAVKCKTHGFIATEAKIVDGHQSWVFECPKCQEDFP